MNAARWDAITWLTVLGMISVLVGLLLAGLFAALSYSTPSVELPLVLTDRLHLRRRVCCCD